MPECDGKKEIRAYNTVTEMGNVVSAITTLIDCVSRIGETLSIGCKMPVPIN